MAPPAALWSRPRFEESFGEISGRSFEEFTEVNLRTAIGTTSRHSTLCTVRANHHVGQRLQVRRAVTPRLANGGEGREGRV